MLVSRIPRKLPLFPFSDLCPECSSLLPWRGKIPIISWFLSASRCGECGAAISIRYPLVEVLSAASALASYHSFGLTPTGFTVYTFLAVLIAISAIDIETILIPNAIIYPGVIASCGLAVASQYSQMFAWPITRGALDSVAGMLLGGGILWAVGFVGWRAFHRDMIGGGVIKLAGFIGMVLGVNSVLPTLVVGAVLTFLAFVASRLRGQKETEFTCAQWQAIGAAAYIFGPPFLRLFA